MKLTHCVTLLTLSAMLASVASAQTREPVYRVGAKVDRATQGESHPLDAALERARHGLQRIRKGDPARNIEPLRDYTCFMFKRERVTFRFSGLILNDMMNTITTTKATKQPKRSFSLDDFAESVVVMSCSLRHEP